uniref:OCEL domain-containing protein n=1 Tax=Catagonus wagneri TaxID=51154 RepID=A0A8C3WKZ1_9CETA
LNARKKVRISHLTATVKSTSNGRVSNTSAGSILGHPPASEATANPIPPPLPTTHLLISNPPQPAYSKCSSYSFPEGPETQDPYVDSENSRLSQLQQGEYTSLETLPSTSIQRKYPKLMEKKHLPSDEFKYKFMERKAKNQDDDIKIMEKEKTNCERQGEGAKPNSSEKVKGVCASSGKTSSASEIPDYLTDYVTIVSSQQRQRYEQEFRVEFEEYKGLYNKMLTLSSIFVYLNSKRKQFTPDSKEYQDINKEITLEYQKMKQKNPYYCAERCRYLYLYNKLVHIKMLINNYDQQQAESQH